MSTLEPLEPGTRVVYYGSLPEQYGAWTVVGLCCCEDCMKVFGEVWDQIYWSLPPGGRPDIAKHYERYDRYELESESGDRLLCVRRSSLTPADI
ncbi:hypothetical protein ACU635_44020 [[Actinomadura] parvosata]|uniref:hypothetical protein n=1 Tax=[Actinomadura] parvosata TaxID=1955412 RepID=UPI00406CA98D